MESFTEAEYTKEKRRLQNMDVEENLIHDRKTNKQTRNKKRGKEDYWYLVW